MNEITVKDVTVYSVDSFLDNVSFAIETGSFVTVLEKESARESLILRSLCGFTSYRGDIFLHEIKLCTDSFAAIYSNLGVVLYDSYKKLKEESVYEELRAALERYDYPQTKIQKRIDAIVDNFSIAPLLDKDTAILSTSDASLTAFLVAIIHKPKILFLEDAFAQMDGVTKRKAFRYLYILKRQKGTTVFYTTHDVEDILHGSEVLLLGDGKLVWKGSVTEALSAEKSFLEIGYSLPFMADLSYKLSYYNLIDAPIMDMKEMVDQLWK